MNLLNGFFIKTTNRKQKKYLNSDVYMYTEQFFLNKNLSYTHQKYDVLSTFKSI